MCAFFDFNTRVIILLLAILIYHVWRSRDPQFREVWLKWITFRSWHNPYWSYPGAFVVVVALGFLIVVLPDQLCRVD